MATLPVRRYEGTSSATAAVAEPFILTEFLFDIVAVRGEEIREDLVAGDLRAWDWAVGGI
jgi:hypothetical protein